MRELKDLTLEEKKQIYLALELDKEESDNKYPDIYPSKGMKVELDDDGKTLIFENDNVWGFAYKINPNGSMSAVCKDDGSERNYAFNCKKVVKLLYDMDIDLLNIKSWFSDEKQKLLKMPETKIECEKCTPKPKYSVIMLPAKTNSTMLRIGSRLVTNFDEYSDHYVNLHKYVPMHLYVVSEERPVSGEWYYYKDSEGHDHIFHWDENASDSTGENHGKKILASNDPEVHTAMTLNRIQMNFIAAYHGLNDVLPEIGPDILNLPA